MATYAPNFTGRVKLSYSTLGANYTNTLRFGATGSASTLIGDIEPFYSALAAFFVNDFAFTASETAAAGDDFFLPIPLGPLGAFTGTSAAFVSNSIEFRASGIQFVGKTTIGQPWRVTIFGALVAPFNSIGESLSDDFRINAADSASVATAIAELEAAVSAGSLCGNDGNPIIFRPYANIIISRYRINRIRRFG